MRIEGDLIKINKWLMPLSWLYGIGVGVRNALFDIGVLKSKSFDVPIISVGNITVGGAGKTPHVEYLTRLLHDKVKVAILSRGYKRKTKGYQLATSSSRSADIGDEPCQFKRKFPDVHVAVDKERRNGIKRLTTDAETADTDVIILDDAFQHRYVKPGINILLVDYHRLIMYDRLLPAGRLREHTRGKARADMVIVTKCPTDLKPMEYRVLTKQISPYPYQDLFFTTMEYGDLYPLHPQIESSNHQIDKSQTEVFVLSGIASPQMMIDDLQKHYENIIPLTFSDHHSYTSKDVEYINKVFADCTKENKIIITTEKDAERLIDSQGLSDEVKAALYILPIKVKFMLDGEESFVQKIQSYVHKNSRNSILVKRKDAHKPDNSNNSGNRPGTISFRDN